MIIIETRLLRSAIIEQTKNIELWKDFEEWLSGRYLNPSNYCRPRDNKNKKQRRQVIEVYTDSNLNKKIYHTIDISTWHVHATLCDVKYEIAGILGLSIFRSLNKKLGMKHVVKTM